MLAKKLFGEATPTINRIDFNLQRSELGIFTLATRALTEDEREISKNITLDTDELKRAIQRSTKCINDIAEDLRPGLRLSEPQAAIGLITSGVTLKRGGEEKFPLPSSLTDALKALEEKHGCSCGHCSHEEDGTEEIFTRVQDLASNVERSMNGLLKIVSQLLRERA